MKARIGTEIRRPGLTTQIASAISTAIASYVDERIFYSESRDVSFATVVSQSLYTSSDHASLALLEQIDYVHLIVDSQNFRLRYMDPEAIERASSSTTSTGQPTDFSWYQEKLRVFPAPSSADWDIRVAGLFQVAAPASDNEASNKWMTDGERLIRSRAKWELAQHLSLIHILTLPTNREV